MSITLNERQPTLNKSFALQIGGLLMKHCSCMKQSKANQSCACSERVNATKGRNAKAL